MIEEIKPELSERKSTPRNPFIAFYLSLLFIGLGQVYNGQPKKGVFYFLLLILSLTFMYFSELALQFYGLISFLIIAVIFRLYVAIDAVVNAKKQKIYFLKPYNTWYYHLLIALAMFILSNSISISDIMGIETFSIPANSNNPTLQIGDRVVADLNAYSTKKVNYGDIVIFNGPTGEIWTFRVIGLPNDTIDIINNIVSINGQSSNATFIRETKNEYFDLNEYREEFPNGHQHHIYTFKTPIDSTKQTIKNIIVPRNSFYLLGDNRDNALDSRYIGLVNRNDIKGKIIYTFWGKSNDRINIDFR